MERFAELLDRLVYTTARNAKLKLLTDYFRTTPDPDRGWALSALTDGLPLRLPIRRTLQTILEPYVDPELYRLSRDYVGDTAETVSLLWPDHRDADPPRLREVVETIKASSLRECRCLGPPRQDRACRSICSRSRRNRGGLARH